jgi:cytochrome P450
MIFLSEKYTLPAGSDCVVAIYGLHKNKAIWGEDVDEFDPDRFLPENVAKRHPYSYIPFSSGPRNCIGTHYINIFLIYINHTIIK